MELTWNEELIIVALRITKPFFSKYGFYINALEFDSRDGEYLSFKNNNKEVKIVLNPGFSIIMETKGFFKSDFKKVIELDSNSTELIEMKKNPSIELGIQVLLDKYLLLVEKNISK